MNSLNINDVVFFLIIILTCLQEIFYHIEAELHRTALCGTMSLCFYVVKFTS
jgi:hypothetical protein